MTIFNSYVKLPEGNSLTANFFVQIASSDYHTF